jgi:hypothetical protein
MTDREREMLRVYGPPETSGRHLKVLVCLSQYYWRLDTARVALPFSAPHEAGMAERVQHWTLR